MCSSDLLDEDAVAVGDTALDICHGDDEVILAHHALDGSGGDLSFHAQAPVAVWLVSGLSALPPKT